jgi:hypothetical protein
MPSQGRINHFLSMYRILGYGCLVQVWKMRMERFSQLMFFKSHRSWNKLISFFYSKTNHMHNIPNLLYFGTMVYMFRMVSPSIIRSLRLYIQHHTMQVLWLLASKQPQNLYDLYLLLYVQSQTPDDGWRDVQNM